MNPFAKISGTILILQNGKKDLSGQVIFIELL
jgi:hypothetical protein